MSNSHTFPFISNFYFRSVIFIHQHTTSSGYEVLPGWTHRHICRKTFRSILRLYFFMRNEKEMPFNTSVNKQTVKLLFDLIKVWIFILDHCMKFLFKWPSNRRYFTRTCALLFEIIFGGKSKIRCCQALMVCAINTVILNSDFTNVTACIDFWWSFHCRF